MNRLSHYSIKFFYCTLITMASLQCSALKITDLQQDYRHQCYMDIYKDKPYNHKNMLVMQLYKFLSAKKLEAKIINIIFSFCGTRPFFSQCNKNCKTHDAILNREFPEFHSFKIIDYIPYAANSLFGFKIVLKRKASKDSIKETFIKEGLLVPAPLFIQYSNMTIIKKKDYSFVKTVGKFKYNRRGKICYNSQPYTLQLFPPSFSNGMQAIDIDHLIEEKAGLRFFFNQHVLDYYCADGLFFVTLIDEHVKDNSRSNELEYDYSFPEPKNHCLQIYDMESQELLHTQKLPLPEKYSFGDYNYLLDYADETGYYLYHFPSKTIIHYLKTKTFDIKNEPATQ
jgi:hypothetical protein